MSESGPNNGPMRAVEDQTFTAMTVSIDDKHFIRCKFKDCVLTYSGADFAFAECLFEGQTRFTLEGPAMRTVSFLNNFNIQARQLAPPAPPIIDPLPSKKKVN